MIFKIKNPFLLATGLFVFCGNSTVLAQSSNPQHGLSKFFGRIFRNKKDPSGKQREEPAPSIAPSIQWSAERLRKALSSGEINLNNLNRNQVEDLLAQKGFLVFDEIKTELKMSYAKSLDSEAGHKKKLAGVDALSSLIFFCELGALETPDLSKIDLNRSCVSLSQQDTETWTVQLKSALNKDRELDPTTPQTSNPFSKLIEENRFETKAHWRLLDPTTQTQAATLLRDSKRPNADAAKAEEITAQLIETLPKSSKLVGSSASKPRPLSRQELFQMAHHLRHKGQLLPEMGLSTLLALKEDSRSNTSKLKSQTALEAAQIFFQDGAGFNNSSSAFKLAKGELENQDVPETEQVHDRSAPGGLRRATSQELFYPFVESLLETISNVPYFTDEMLHELEENQLNPPEATQANRA